MFTTIYRISPLLGNHSINVFLLETHKLTLHNQEEIRSLDHIEEVLTILLIVKPFKQSIMESIEWETVTSPSLKNLLVISEIFS